MRLAAKGCRKWHIFPHFAANWECLFRCKTDTIAEIDWKKAMALRLKCGAARIITIEKIQHNEQSNWH